MQIFKTVRHVMVPVQQYPVIYEDETFNDAVDVLRDTFYEKGGTWYGFQSLLVRNHKEELVGIITLRSLLKSIKLQANLDYLLKGDPTGLFFMPQFKKGFYLNVKDIMRPLKMVTVQVDNDIFEAVLIMVKHKINSLPVMEGKKLVGVVRTIDLFWSVGELLD